MGLGNIELHYRNMDIWPKLPPILFRLLRAKNRDGTYLIREGSHAGAEKVLSVWHIDRCRHYKLFKDKVSEVVMLTVVDNFDCI